MIQKFTQNGFDLDIFKELLIQMFGNKISFIPPITQRYKEHTHILEKIQICKNISLADSNELEILIFKVSSINAKIALHSELKRILRNSYSDAILAVFCQDTQNQKSPSLAVLGAGYEIATTPKNSQNSATARHSEPATAGEESTAKGVNLKMDENSQNSLNFLENSQENSQNQDLKEFRLSLITSKLDKNNIKYSNLKRQSFILGHSKTHTAQKALATLISKAQKNITLQDLENAFSQEPVSKEFYKEIIEQYLEILECATFPAHATQYDKKSFCLRLLCRILFCKFLEKKALLSAEIWDTNLSKDYYHEALEPLFFATLNTPLNLRDYGLLPTQITNLLSKIPYLNGGLFSPQDKDFYSPIYINTLHIPNTAFDNLFALLDRYNFTLDENSYNDYEVSLNPELLGTVFESLLSQLFTDNVAENLQSLRKATGSYYTPREIVSYMVRQSLFAYLKNSVKIHENKLHALVFDENFAENSNQKSLASEDFNQKSPSLAEGDLGGGLSKNDKNSANSLNLKTSSSENSQILQNSNNAQNTHPQTPSAREGAFKGEPNAVEGALNLALTQAQKTELLSALKSLKILDPACGSGAFPMGILNEILLLQEKCGDERDIYERKLELLQGCIYGIDIQPMATEIARLRCFLSLIIDENPSDIKPLPNLEFKFMQGNSLLETLSVGNSMLEIIPKDYLAPQKVGLFDEGEIKSAKDLSLFDEKDYKHLQGLFVRYFSTSKSSEKQSLKNEILDLMRQVFDKRQADFESEIETLNKELKNSNPRNAKRYADQITDLMSAGAALQSLLDDYATHDFSSDKLFLYRFFFAEVMQNGGFDIIIGNPPYIDYRKIDLRTKNALNTTSKIYKDSKEGSIYVYFIEKGKEVLAQNGSLIFINPISYLCQDSGFGLRNFIDKNLSLNLMLNISNLKVFDNAATYTCINHFTHKNSEHKTLKFGTANEKENLSAINLQEIEQCKIENLSLLLNPITTKIFKANYPRLSEFCEIFCGLSKTGFRESVEFEKKETNSPFLEASDIFRYEFKQGKFLSQIPFYYSQDKINIFENKEVIFMARMTNFIRCCVAPSGYFGGKVNVLYDFKVDKLYILGILNSKLMSYFYANKYFASHLQGGAFGFDTLSVKSLPIPKPNLANQSLIDEIINLVDKIVKFKGQGKDTIEFKNKIDKLVYRLYGLNDDEIKSINY